MFFSYFIFKCKHIFNEKTFKNIVIFMLHEKSSYRLQLSAEVREWRDCETNGMYKHILAML